MSEAHIGRCAHGGNGCESGDIAAGAVYLLSLAAAPAFAMMALVTGAIGGGTAGMLCPPAHDASPLTGMALMYVLMSVFHSAPWLRLVSSRRRGAGPGRDEYDGR